MSGTLEWHCRDFRGVPDGAKIKGHKSLVRKDLMFEESLDRS